MGRLVDVLIITTRNAFHITITLFHHTCPRTSNNGNHIATNGYTRYENILTAIMESSGDEQAARKSLTSCGYSLTEHKAGYKNS